MPRREPNVVISGPPDKVLRAADQIRSGREVDLAVLLQDPANNVRCVREEPVKKTMMHEGVERELVSVVNRPCGSLTKSSVEQFLERNYGGRTWACTVEDEVGHPLASFRLSISAKPKPVFIDDDPEEEEEAEEAPMSFSPFQSAMQDQRSDPRFDPRFAPVNDGGFDPRQDPRLMGSPHIRHQSQHYNPHVPSARDRIEERKAELELAKIERQARIDEIEARGMIHGKDNAEVERLRSEVSMAKTEAERTQRDFASFKSDMKDEVRDLKAAFQAKVDALDRLRDKAEAEHKNQEKDYQKKLEDAMREFRSGLDQVGRTMTESINTLRTQITDKSGQGDMLALFSQMQNSLNSIFAQSNKTMIEMISRKSDEPSDFEKIVGAFQALNEISGGGPRTTTDVIVSAVDTNLAKVLDFMNEKQKIGIETTKKMIEDKIDSVTKELAPSIRDTVKETIVKEVDKRIPVRRPQPRPPAPQPTQPPAPQPTQPQAAPQAAPAPQPTGNPPEPAKPSDDDIQMIMEERGRRSVSEFLRKLSEEHDPAQLENIPWIDWAQNNLPQKFMSDLFMVLERMAVASDQDAAAAELGNIGRLLVEYVEISEIAGVAELLQNSEAERQWFMMGLIKLRERFKEPLDFSRFDSLSKSSEGTTS